MSSQWPELVPEPDHPFRRQLAPFVIAALGGAIGWTLTYVWLNLWGLAVGAIMVVAVAALRSNRSRRRSESVALSLAWILLSWPLIWVIAMFVRYWITGQTIGA